MPNLEQQLRDVRPAWPEPSERAEARARAAIGIEAPSSPARRWAALAPRPRHGSRLLVAAALLLTAGAAVAATLISRGGSEPARGPAASLSFGAPEVVGRPVSQIDGPPVLAIDGRGTVTVAWARAGRIVVATRPAGAAWSEPERISDPSRRASYPAIGSDAEGGTTVIWRERTAGRRITQTFRLPSGAPAGELSDLVARRWAVVGRHRSAEGVWGAAQDVSPQSATVRDLESPGLGVFADGSSVATWDQGGAVWSSTRTSSGAWLTPVRVGSGPGEAVDPQLSIDPSGRAALIWSNRAGQGLERRYTLQVARFATRTGWGASSVIGTPTINPPYPATAIDSTGRGVAAWSGTRNLDQPGVIWAVTADASGAWSTETLVGRTAPGFNDLRALAAMADGGTAVLLPDSSSAFQAPVGGEWTPLALRPVAGRPFSAALGVDPSRATVLVRGTIEPNQSVVERRVGMSGATERARIDGVSFRLALAIGPDGTSALAWVGGGSSPAVIVTVADGSPPARGGGG